MQNAKCKMQKLKVKSYKSLISVCALFCSITFAFLLLPCSFATGEGLELLETGSAARLRYASPDAAELKIVTYNMRWRSGHDLSEITYLLRNDPEIGSAAIIGLQEVDRRKKRSGFTNTARLMAEELGMYYAWAAPPLSERDEKGEEETGVAILSHYPMTDVRRIVLPNEGPGGRRRVALGATLRIGAQHIRVYSVHAETRISTKKRAEQLQAVLDDLKTFTSVTRSVVLGDFNTIGGDAVEKTSRLFADAGFETPFPNSKTTWKTFIIELKLDWIWLKGLTSNGYGIDKEVGYSDHWPLWVKVNLKGNAPDKTSLRAPIIKKD